MSMIGDFIDISPERVLDRFVSVRLLPLKKLEDRRVGESRRQFAAFN
jgi:hypothetical protein